MKISVIITTLLVAQVSASFFDVFHGAVLSVQNSFGKLLSDVVTDVKDTVDCTILAVEHVLSLSPDATTRYYEKCGGETNKTESVTEAPPDASVPKVELTLNLQNNEEYLQKLLPVEIDARINETLSKVLGNYKPYDNVLSIDNVLAKESEQLAGVSGLVKKELEKLSNEVTSDLKYIEKERDSQPSVDTILQEIKVLEKREQNTKNTSEANEIHQVIDQVLGKLDAIEATEANENVKLEEILKDLENNSNNSFVGLRRQFEEWKEEESRHLSEIKSKIEEHEKISDYHYGSYRHDSDQSQPVISDPDKNRVDVDPISRSSETSTSKNISLVKEILDNSANSSTIDYSKNKALIAVANEASPSSNKKLEDSGLNDTVITRNSYSAKNNPIGNEVIHRFERPTSNRSSDLSTNQSTTAQNNVTGDDTNVPILNTPLSITDSVPGNETIQPVESIADSDKQQSLVTIEATYTDKKNQSVMMSNTVHTSDTTNTEDIVPSVNSNTDSGKVKLSSHYRKNDTIIRNATETAVTEMTITSQNNNNSKDIVISRIANAVFENTFVNGTSSENKSLTLAIKKLANSLATYVDTESDGTMITNTSSSINFSTPVNEKTLLIESSTAASTVKTEIVSDHDYNNNLLPTTFSPKSESTLSENIRTEETAWNSGKDQSTSEGSKIMNGTTITSTLPTKKGSFISESDRIKDTNKIYINEESSTITTTKIHENDSSNTMKTNVSLPIVENTLISENTITSSTIEPKETGTNAASGKEDSLNGLNESIVASTSLPIIESAPVTEALQSKDMASGNEDSSNDLNGNIIATTSLPILENAPVTEAIQPKYIASGNKDSSNDLNGNIIATISLPIIESAPVTQAIQPKYMASGNEDSSNDLNGNVVTSTSLPITESAHVTEVIQTRDMASGNEDSSNALDETIMVSSSLPIIESVPVTETIQPKETSTSSSNSESSKNIKNDSDTLITRNISPTVENTSVSVTIKPEKSATASGYKELTDTVTELTTIAKIENESNSDTTVTSTLTPIVSISDSENIQGMSVSRVTIKPEKNTTASGYKELTESTTISKMENENNSDTTITSTLTPIIIISESEDIQAMDTTTVASSEEESLNSTATETSNGADDDDDDDDDDVDSSGTVLSSTPETISENDPEENDTASENDAATENDATLTTILNSTIASPATLIDTDSDSDALDDYSNENVDNYDTVMSIAEKTNSAVAAESNQIVEITTASEKQDLSSTSTQSAKNEIVTTRSRTKEDSGISSKLEADTFSRTPDIPDLNHLIRSLPLTITENPLVNRERLALNKLDQQNYNSNLAPINNYDLNAPKTLSDRLLKTRQPLINIKEPYKMPIYNQLTMPTITLDEKLDDAKAFAIFDAIDERLSHSDSPFGPDKDIPKTVDIPSAPIIMNAPRKLIDPGRMNYENPAFGPTALRPLNSFDDRAPVNIFRPQGLTTHRPRTGPRHSYKSPPMDYDSFFHMPPRNSDAHQRALQEARQLIANSKRSDRIINNIMKNKNKFNARSIFR